MEGAALHVPQPDVCPDDTLERARAGDEAAFDRLYEQHVGRVYALCLRLAGSAVEAESLTQDVFVAAWRGLPSFRGESALGSWLHRLAVNALLDRRRGDRRREARVQLAEDPAALPGACTAPAPVEARIDLERAVASLPEGARLILVLHDIEGYTHEEIAQMCGVAVGTSKAQLHRARSLLRERLER